MRRAASAVLAVLLAAFALAAQAQEQPLPARIDGGVIIGRVQGDIESFKGVPFAAPPMGDLRWRPPQPVRPWSHPKDASLFGDACLQPPPLDASMNAAGYGGRASEDCLTLNVFAPTGARQAPVMVWIHGGANIYGASSLPAYDGTAFARDGIVLVAVNYRLGAFGFFAHPALSKAAKPGEALANYGLMDQIAGLEWVKRNISAFGGDPSNVTVFGESAGGVDVLALMTSPAAKGLFRKAIIESGGGWFPADALSAAEAKGEALARKAGAMPGATAADLRAIPAAKLVGLTTGIVGPIVDGSLLSQDPASAFARGEFTSVPLIIGSNSNEASLMRSLSIDPASFARLFPGQLRSAYRDQGNEAAQGAALFTDAAMGAPARWIAAHNAAKAPSWLYYFSYVGVAQRSTLSGASHASEIPYVFDSQEALPAASSQIQPPDRALAKVMHACWTAFAMDDSPSCEGVQGWPGYTPDKDQAIEFGLTVRVRTHLNKSKFDLLDRVEAARLAQAGDE